LISRRGRRKRNQILKKKKIVKKTELRKIPVNLRVRAISPLTESRIGELEVNGRKGNYFEIESFHWFLFFCQFYSSFLERKTKFLFFLWISGD